MLCVLIYANGSLGTPVQFTASNVYENTGVNVNGQNAFGVVFLTDAPAIGVRITASGHDTSMKWTSTPISAPICGSVVLAFLRPGYNTS